MLCLLGTVAGLFAGDTAYLFSYFINDSRDGLHLAYSLDGLTWTPLNHGKSFLIPTVGKDRLMRDPSICQAPGRNLSHGVDFQLDRPDYRLRLFSRFNPLE